MWGCAVSVRGHGGAQAAEERNYHIFYQLLAGVPAAEREELRLSADINDFHYVRQVRASGTLVPRAEHPHYTHTHTCTHTYTHTHALSLLFIFLMSLRGRGGVARWPI
jgi:hypothetical protein